MELKHPSGLDEEYLAYVSMAFWMLKDNKDLTVLSPDMWSRLLSFQQGFKAALEYIEKQKT